MYLQRPGEAAGRGRFWLALSLSTVTAAAVAAPLALKAVSVDAERDPAAQIGGNTVPSTTPESPTTIELPGIVDDDRDGRGNIGPAQSTESTSTTEGDGQDEDSPDGTETTVVPD
jgi:hypothetical protein